MSYRSKKILGEEDSAFARSLFKAMGYTDSELKMGKPLIGIANTWNTLDPGHFGLDKVAEAVKNGIYAAGGTPATFGTIAACDGVAQGNEGMNYILPSREIICDSVEIMAQAHRLDGLVLLPGFGDHLGGDRIGQDGQVLHAPALVFRVHLVRLLKRHQMSHGPGDQVFLVLQAAFAPFPAAQHPGDFPPHAGLFRNHYDH